MGLCWSGVSSIFRRHRRCALPLSLIHISAYGCPQRIDIADALDGPTGIVGPEDVESSGKYEPEPADGLSEAVLGRGIGDPDQKRIGEQRITEPAQGIGCLLYTSCRIARRRHKSTNFIRLHTNTLTKYQYGTWRSYVISVFFCYFCNG